MKNMGKFVNFLVLLGLFFGSCKTDRSLFKLISAQHSGIHFNNNIVENDSINPIDVTNIYNGGGVGIGDFNNDGLQDVYFTGNQVSNKLYLNRGEFRFDEVTLSAKVTGDNKWCRGVAVVDINNDGWQDMYVCATILSEAAKRQNLLYINQGVNGAGVPVFKELAAEYGLNDTSYSTMANFFDYDNDGDLDVYITVNEIVKGNNPGIYRPKITDGSFPSTGRLYRNDWNTNAKHAFFVNVTKQAAVTIEGYGHGASVADFNRDGWKDIFVANDFNSNDLLYINNRNGTFTDKASAYFKHTSANGMGQDVIDINNDGLSDVVELDMDPEDNFRKKMMLGANSYQNYQTSDHFGYQYQYVRNTLQLNQGPRVTEGDTIGDPIFSDVGFFSGISATDWSWTPLVQDFDNDGFRDIIITNGYPKDLTDHDFIAFRQESGGIASKGFVLSQIPQVKIHNYAFHNNGNVTFSDYTKNWGFSIPSFSNGAAYADLDNDGDLDIVINNINDKAFIYQNTLMEATRAKKNKPNYLSVKLIGDSGNRNGLGTWIALYYGSQQQVLEQSPYRGYLSTIQASSHFGLGDISKIDSLVIKWPDLTKQVFVNVSSNQTIIAHHKNATGYYTWNNDVLTNHSLFTDVTRSAGIGYQHKATDFVDFNIQKLLPHKFSEYDPALATGDVNGDGLDDIVAGGSVSNSPVLFLQQKNGLFNQKNILPHKTVEIGKDMGIVLFDADGDDDLDVYTASGGYQSKANTDAYRDKLYINTGKGIFSIDSVALPQNFTSKSCVRATDFDNDGDLDLFIAGRVDPWNYPKPVSSFIYRNDTKNSVVKFTDVTSLVAKSLQHIGLISDATFTDFDNDGWQDLILAGEWMPVSFFKNTKGVFENITKSTGVSDKSGWWTSITPGDFDNDGDMDYIVGNLGLNSFYTASDRYPVSIYAKDFNGDGNYDAIPTLYLPTSQQDTTKREYPAHVRDDLTRQLISFRSKFQNYKSYANATFDSMFTAKELTGAQLLRANYFSNSLLKNRGNGKFVMVPLPTALQYSCINGMVAEDFDGDGNTDIVTTGNDYGTEPNVGRYDACNGTFMKGDGQGAFLPLSILQSGIFVPGNGKALVKLRSSSGKCLIAASQNNGPMKIFQLKVPCKTISLNTLDISAKILYKDGRHQKREIGYGSSFMSQSGRFINVDDKVVSVEIKNSKNEVRKVFVQ